MENKRLNAYRYGIRAEQLATLYLRCKGYRIIASRYRNHAGEIDIIAAKSSTLIAVEVKARKHLADCAESIPAAKQAKIARALEGFLAGHGSIGTTLNGLAHPTNHKLYQNIRFDVVWMSPRHWPVHLKDAWRM